MSGVDGRHEMYTFLQAMGLHRWAWHALLLVVAGGTGLTLPLAGNYSELFFWYTTVHLGQDAQPFTVTVDTGSSDFMVPQLGCSNCIGVRASLLQRDVRAHHRRVGARAIRASTTTSLGTPLDVIPRCTARALLRPRCARST